jgi:acyl-CoA synthetase (NDP forming)
VIHDRAPHGKIYETYLSYMQRARPESGKPVALVAARQGTGRDDAVVASTHSGYPVLDGVSQFLAGVRVLFAYRDFQLRETASPRPVDNNALETWKSRLAGDVALGEADSLAMLNDFGVTTSAAMRANSARSAIAAAQSLGYPVVLKTAREGMLHKSDHGGVILGIADAGQLQQAYDTLSDRLGDDVLVSVMAPAGIEMILGVSRDPQFGSVVMIGFGGVLAETINDVEFALPPFDAAHARRCVDRLRLRPLLDGVRGEPPADIDAFCDVAARFSEMAAALGEVLMEVDVNPVIVHTDGAVAVDALVAGRDRREAFRAET